jgi:malate synthase
VSLLYLASWLGGTGCVPIDGLMEDAATAEISRAQVWQWRRHGARLDDGRLVDEALIRTVVDEEAARSGPVPKLAAARALFLRLCLSPTFEEFLTLPAYETLLSEE